MKEYHEAIHDSAIKPLYQLAQIPNMLEINHWMTPDKRPAPPGSGEIHLWKIDVEMTGVNLLPLLTDDERARADSLLQARDRLRFINARGGVRSILSHYLARPAESIRLTYGTKGKPALGDDMPLHFNITHADGLALIAISTEQPVGIDLEKVRWRNNLRRIARRAFDSAQLRQLEALPETQFVDGFYARWTTLEARVKAVGEGVFGRTVAIERTQCINFQPLPGWCAALASDGPLPAPASWSCYRFQPELDRQIG